MKKIQILISALVLTLLLPAAAWAAWPEKPVTLIVPMPAGGNVDMVARLIVPYLEKDLGQKVIIRNVPGTAGIIGTTEAARAKPDGYTFLVSPVGPLTIQPQIRKTNYSIDSFDFLNMLLVAPNFLMVLPSAPWNDFDAFVADAKANPNKYAYGSAGPATIPFFSGYAVAKEFGLDLVHFPDKSSVDTVRNMENGSCHMNADSASLMVQYNLKPLVYFGNERHPEFPNVPTLKEKGANINPDALRGITFMLAPKGTPKDIEMRMHEIMARTAKNPDFLTACTRLGGFPSDMSMEELSQFIKDSASIYSDLIASAGLKQN